MIKYKYKIGQCVKTKTTLGECGNKPVIIISRKRYTDRIFDPIEYKVLICGIETPQFLSQCWLEEIK